VLGALGREVKDIDFEHKVIRLRHNTSTKRAGVALFDDELAGYPCSST